MLPILTKKKKKKKITKHMEQTTNPQESRSNTMTFKERWSINHPENTDYQDHSQLMIAFEGADNLIQRHTFDTSGNRKPGWTPEEDENFWPHFRSWRDQWKETVDIGTF